MENRGRDDRGDVSGGGGADGVRVRRWNQAEAERLRAIHSGTDERIESGRDGGPGADAAGEHVPLTGPVPIRANEQRPGAEGWDASEAQAGPDPQAGSEIHHGVEKPVADEITSGPDPQAGSEIQAGADKRAEDEKTNGPCNHEADGLYCMLAQDHDGPHHPVDIGIECGT